MLSKIKSKYSNDSNFKELLTGSAITFVFKMLGLLFGYIVVYLISKKNGSEGVGYYSMVNQILFVLGLLGALGTNTSVLRYIGQYNNESDRPILKIIYLNVLKIALPLSILLSLALYFFADVIATSLFKEADYSDPIRMIAFVLPLFTIDRIGVEFIRGLKRLKLSEFIRTTSKPLIMLGFLGFYWQHDIKNIQIVYFIAIAASVNFVLSNSAILLFIRNFGQKIHNQLSVSEMIKTSAPMMISNLSGALMNTSIIFLLQFFMNTSDVGIYAVCWSIVQFISIVLIVVNTIAAPKFAELFWGGKHEELQKVITQSAKMMFWGSIFVASIISLGAHWILQIFGNEFIEGKWVLYILILQQLVNSSAGSVGLILNMSNQQKFRRNSGLLSLAIQVSSAAILIPFFGILGAAFAALIGGSLWNIVCAVYVRKKLNIKSYYLFL